MPCRMCHLDNVSRAQFCTLISNSFDKKKKKEKSIMTYKVLINMKYRIQKDNML